MTRFPSAKCLILPSRRPLDRLRKRQGPWDRVTWHFSCRDCNMNISEVDSSVKHSGCNSNQVQEAIRSIRQWAAFRAFKEAKAAGRETFTVEDWQRWMAVAGHSLGNPSDEEFSQVMQFGQVLDVLPTDRMDYLTTRVEAGEALVLSTNQFPPWRSSSRGRKREAPPAFGWVSQRPSDIEPKRQMTLILDRRQKTPTSQAPSVKYPYPFSWS